jgi:hypothetical protein
VVLQGSEAKQQKEKYTLSTRESDEIYFQSNSNQRGCCTDKSTRESRIVKTRRAATHLPDANITKPPPLAVVILLPMQSQSSTKNTSPYRLAIALTDGRSIGFFFAAKSENKKLPGVLSTLLFGIKVPFRDTDEGEN